MPAATDAAADKWHMAVLQDRVDQLVRAYRVRGHIGGAARSAGLSAPDLPELDPAFYGFTDADLDRDFSTDTIEGPQSLTLRRIIERLRNTYCRSIGVQFMHIDDLTVRHWLQDRMEGSENRLHAAPARAVAHSHAADRRRDLRGVHPEDDSSAPRAFRSKGPKA